MSDITSIIESQLIEYVGPRVRQAVEEAVKRKVLSFSSSEILAFVDSSGKEYKPEVDVTYAKVLWCFVRAKKYNSEELDSIITKPIVEVTQNTIVSELNNEQTRDLIIEGFLSGSDIDEEVRKSLDNEVGWATDQVLISIGLSPNAIAAQKIADMTAGNASDIVNSGFGKTVLAGFAQMCATSAGKAIIAKIISLSVVKIAGGTLVKAAVVSGLKKFAILLVVKTFIVKVLSALFPALVSAKVPLFWIFLPIIAAFIYHEMKHMPNKLSTTLPEKLGLEVEKNFPSIAEKFSELVAANAVIEVANAALRKGGD